MKTPGRSTISTCTWRCNEGKGVTFLKTQPQRRSAADKDARWRRKELIPLGRRDGQLRPSGAHAVIHGDDPGFYVGVLVITPKQVIGPHCGYAFNSRDLIAKRDGQ